MVRIYLIVAKTFSKYSLCPLIQVAEMLFIDGSRTSPLVTFAPLTLTLPLGGGREGWG